MLEGKMSKKKFIVEIDIPEETGDLCWDNDETGLQAFHDCIVPALAESNLRWLVAAQGERVEFQNFIERKNAVRDSFKVLDTIKDS
jgi:hypothetical protein